MILVRNIFGLDRQQHRTQLVIVTDQVRVFPRDKEPPVALGRIVRLDLSHPPRCVRRNVVPGVVIGPIDPVAPAVWYHNHLVRSRFAEVILEQSLQRRHRRNDRRTL